jgi:hypothetical protein
MGDQNDDDGDPYREHKKKSLKEYLGEEFDKYFTDSIPVEAVKDFPYSYKYIFGCMIFSVILAAFVYFIVTGEPIMKYFPMYL